MTLNSYNVRVFCLVWTAGFLLTLTGCDLLQTREPQPPGGQSSTFVPPTSPGYLITNLRNAIHEKNTEIYLGCLVNAAYTTNPFQFEPSIEARSKHGLTFSNWTVLSEEQYFKNLAASKQDGISQLDLFDTQELSQSPDSVVFRAKYHLIFQHTENSLAEEEARGKLEFSLIRDLRGYWTVFRWIDYSDTSATTWSDFKGTFLR